jgi:hypothetical protein
MKKIPHSVLLSLALPLAWLPVRAADAASPAIPVAQESSLSLIPWPAKITQAERRFPLTEKATIVADAAFAREATLLATSLALPL